MDRQIPDELLKHDTSFWSIPEERLCYRGNINREDGKITRETNEERLKRELHPLIECNKHPYLSDLAEDPALIYYFDRVRPEWVVLYMLKKNPDFPYGEKDIVENRVMVARNLYFSGRPPIEVTQESVFYELDRIDDGLDVYKDVPLFKGRHVLVLANDEMKSTWGGNIKRFSPKYVLQKIEYSQGDKNLKSGIIFPNKKTAPLDQVKEQAKKSIVDYPCPMTLVLMGHGTKKGFLFHGHSEKTKYVLTNEDLAEALHKRSLKYREEFKDPIMRDIIILGNCRSQEIARGTNAGFERRQETEAAAKPLAYIARCEYGQNGWLRYARQDRYFFSDFLGLENVTPTIGAVIDNQWRGDSNACVLICSDSKGKGPMMQISKEESDPDSGNL